VVATGLLVTGGCAKYNTFYNAQKAFADAERAREDALEKGEDVERATTAQKQNYQRAIAKAQKILDEYPGHSLTDDALFVQGKAYHRLGSYRMAIRKLDLLFVNFPQSPFTEEGLYVQAVNYLMLGDAERSQDLLDTLERQFPESRFQSEALRASGDSAYALRDWEEAVAAFRLFLDRHPDAEDWDDSSQRLAESLWELDRFDEAIPVLERIIAGSALADRVFRARLLLARCLVRTGDQARVEAMLPELKTEAEIYSKQGDVVLVEAENLIAREDVGSAQAMLENMPAEQLSRDVKPVRADMLGYSYLSGGSLEIEDLEKARDYFQEAIPGGELLEDPDGTRLLLDTIRDYLAAAGQLPDAQPDRAARLRLSQANALLFGFDRPRAAFELYAAVAADTAADSTVASRALYGAMLVQDQYLGHPDSASIYRDELKARYPGSPQAYQVSAGVDADLLEFLLAQEEAAMRAAGRDSALAAAGGELAAAMDGGGALGLRRQLVYLQRRPNLRYSPPAAAVEALELRRRDLAQARQDVRNAVTPQAAPAETLGFREPPARSVPPGSVQGAPVDSLSSRSIVPAPADSLVPPAIVPAPADSQTVPRTAPAPVDSASVEREPTEPPQKEKPKRWDL